jgi:hypothetical protein
VCSSRHSISSMYSQYQESSGLALSAIRSMIQYDRLLTCSDINNKCVSYIPCMLGDHFTHRCRSNIKLEMELTGGWYEFNVWNKAKYYLEGEWRMSASIYILNKLMSCVLSLPNHPQTLNSLPYAPVAGGFRLPRSGRT